MRSLPWRVRLPGGRLIALFILLTVVPLALLAFLSVSLASEALTREVESRLGSTAQASAIAVQRETQGLSELVRSFAGRPTLRGALADGDPTRRNGEKIAFQLQSLRQSRPGIVAAFLADASGRLIDIAPADPSLVGSDFSYRDWYRGVKATGRAYVSEAFEGRVAGSPRVVAVAVPVRPSGRSGPPLAILGVAYRLEAYQEFVDRFASSQRLTLTDQNGVVLAARGQLPEGLVSLRDDPLVAAALRGGSGVTAVTAEDGRLLSAYVAVPELGWTLTASVPERTALEPVARLRSAVLAITGVIGVVLLGGLVALVLTLRARERAEAAAEQARAEAEQTARLNAQLVALVQGSEEAIIGMGLDGTIESWNEAAERLYGYRAAEVVGKTIGILIPEDRSSEKQTLFEQVTAGRAIEYFETERRRKDGSLAQVAITVSPIRAAGGEIVGVSTIARDISERKQAEEEIKRTRAQAERANEAKSDFLSRMSHELRTPLNAVLGFGQLLAMDGLEARQQESVDQILKAGEHLLGLINEVLDISRIEAGKLSLSLEPVAVDEAVAEALDLVRPIAANRQITLSAETRAGGDWVLADRQRLKQILLNLLSNGVKYNRERGHVGVCVSRLNDETVGIEVIDTGNGIAPDSIDRLFSPFERLGAEVSYAEGTGLGLALSKRLAEAMGGTLGVESSVGRGSNFVLALPAAEGLVDSADRAENVAHSPAAAAGRSKRTVLYIEDNLSNVKLVEHVLANRPDVELVVAMQGGLGLDLAREHTLDLILLDLHLPDIPGDEALARLRAEPATRTTPIVVLSADATPGRIQRILAQGATDYVPKPLDVKRFLEILGDYLDAEERADEGIRAGIA